MKFWFTKDKAQSEDPVAGQAPLAKKLEVPASKPKPTQAEILAAVAAHQAKMQQAGAASTAQPPAAVPAAAASASPAVPAKKPQNDPKTVFYKFINALYDVVLVLDENGHITDCNERVMSVLGQIRTNLWDVPVTDIIPALNLQVFTQIKQGLESGRRVMINARCHRIDKTSFVAEVGVGKMEFVGKSYVLTIRNIENRHLPKSATKPPQDPKSIPKPALIRKKVEETAK